MTVQGKLIGPLQPGGTIETDPLEAIPGLEIDLANEI